MKSNLNVRLVLVVSIAIISLATSNQEVGNFADPKYPNKCKISDDLILNAGTFSDPNSCREIMCDKSGSAVISNCIEAVIDGCRTGDVIDSELSYPACCKRYYHCKKPNGKDKIIQLK